MSLSHDNKPAITRTERGLTISGTRITLYQIMDYIHANYPRHLIRHQFYLTDEQFDAAISYIDAHYEEVESEYQIVVQQAEEIRDYWNERNKERIANISKLPPKPEYASAWQKLQARKAKRAALSR
jgi:uncharacterized protein (DUF433 family)